MTQTPPGQPVLGSNLALFLIMSALWGATWLPLKVASEHLPPVTIAFVRFLLAGPLFFLLARGAPLGIRREDWPRLAASALLMNSANYAILFWGVARAPSGLAAVVNFAATPLTFILLGAMTGRERADAARLASVALGIAGLALLFSSQASLASAHPEAGWGLAACALSTLCYCGGAVMTQPLLPKYPAAALAGWQGCIGAAGLAVLMLLAEPPTLQHVRALLTWPVALSIAALVIGGSLAGYTIYLRLLKAWGAFRSGLYAFVSPVVAVAMGWMFLGEALSWTERAGAALMFSAMGLALRPSRQ